MTNRRAEIEARLLAVRQEIAQAVGESRRNPAAVPVIAIHKNKPAHDPPLVDELRGT